MLVLFPHVVCTSVSQSIPTFQNLAKQNKLRGVTVGPTGWIIHDTCLVFMWLFFLRPT